MSEHKVAPEEMIALVHGRLSSEETIRVEALVQADQNLRAEVEELRTVARSLDEMMLMSIEPMPSVADEVMGELTEAPPSRTLYRLAAVFTVCSALVVGLFIWRDISPAPVAPPPYYGGGGSGVYYNDTKVANATDVFMTYLEGSFGALVMLLSGCLAVTFLVIGTIKRKPRFKGAALLFFILAVAFLLLKIAISIFFNDTEMYS